MAHMLLYLLLGVAVLASAVIVILWQAWRRSRRALLAMALRMDAEGQINVATMHTLSAMRDAAHAYVRRQSP